MSDTSQTNQEIIEPGRDTRRNALDDFARSASVDRPQRDMVPASHTDLFGARGAIPVAVKRDENQILQRLGVLASAAGSDWFYRWPVKAKQPDGTYRTDYVEGPSIKLANDLARLYGNCKVDTRVVDLGSHFLIYALFEDHETGFSLVRPFQQRKSQRAGERMETDRAMDIALQIGVSKAIRNVVVNGLQTFADFALEEAKGALVEKIGKDLPKWRDRTIERTKTHVDIARVERVIGRPAGDWLAQDVARVIAMMQSAADGMASLDDLFPPLVSAAAEGTAQEAGQAGEAEQQPASPASKAQLDALATSGDEKKPEQQGNVGTAGGSGGTSSAAAGEKPAASGTAGASAQAQPQSAQREAGAARKQEPVDAAPADPKPSATGLVRGQPPKTADQYVEFFRGWLAETTSGEGIDQRWRQERNLRNQCGLTSEVRDGLEDERDKRKQALGGKS